MRICIPKCHLTGSFDPASGRRLMISQGGKFPVNTLNGICDECQAAMLEEAKIAILFNNDRTLIEQYKKLKEKF